MCAELLLRKIALEPPSFLSVRIEDEYGRGPKRVKAPKVFRVLFYMDVKRDKILFNERRQTGISIRLLFETQTRSSTRCNAKVDQHRFVLSLCSLERRIGIGGPINRHYSPPVL